jgi:hypothetical protein
VTTSKGDLHREPSGIVRDNLVLGHVLNMARPWVIPKRKRQESTQGRSNCLIHYRAGRMGRWLAGERLWSSAARTWPALLDVLPIDSRAVVRHSLNLHCSAICCTPTMRRHLFRRPLHSEQVFSVQPPARRAMAHC